MINNHGIGRVAQSYKTAALPSLLAALTAYLAFSHDGNDRNFHSPLLSLAMAIVVCFCVQSLSEHLLYYKMNYGKWDLCFMLKLCAEKISFLCA
ncbi:hypothetical protein NIES3585_40400 [Nodularia sp. NIES-3585]|nr:hypothetical protein NIES3585_40400 [Nodularia sp. NIES-3585]